MSEEMKEEFMVCPGCGLDAVWGAEKCPYCGVNYKAAAETKRAQGETVATWDVPTGAETNRSNTDFSPNTTEWTETAGTMGSGSYGSLQKRPNVNKYDEGLAYAKPAPNNGKPLFIVLAVLGVIAVLALLWKFGLFTKKDSKVPYTPGTYNSTEYTNPWSGINFRFTDDFQNANSMVYSLLNQQILKNSPMETELIVTSKADSFGDASGLFILSYKLNKKEAKDKNLMKKLANEFSTSGVVTTSGGNTVSEIKECGATTVCGKTYQKFQIKGRSNQNKDIKMTMMFRKIDGYVDMICILENTRYQEFAYLNCFR